MKSLIFIMAFLFLELVYSAPRTNSKNDFKIAVKFDRSFYQLAANDKILIYRQSGNDFWIPVQKCNQATVKKITDRYHSLLAEHENDKVRRPSSEFDVEIIPSKGRSIMVARGSRFGTWLRNMPSKIMSYDLEARLSCKR